MTPRQKEEIESIPMRHMVPILARLREVGKERAADLLNDYEERLAIICEGSEAQPEDISAAWADVLGMKELRQAEKRGGMKE